MEPNTTELTPTAELIERGHAALISQLGASNAAAFLSAITQGDDFLKMQGDQNVVAEIGVSPQTGEVVLKFAQPLKWLAFPQDKAFEFARTIVKQAQRLGRGIS